MPSGFFAPLTAPWADFHGGFVTGLFMQARYLAGSAWEALGDRSERPGALRLAAGLALSALAAAANPAGLKLLSYSLGYLPALHDFSAWRELYSDSTAAAFAHERASAPGTAAGR